MNLNADIAGEAAHRAAREALPWLLNGSLEGGELDAVRAHVRSCALCRQELNQLRNLREAAQASPVPAIDPERALARMLSRLDTAQPSIPRPGLLPRWRARLAANEAAWLRGALVAQAAAIAALLVALVRPADTGAYRVLGANARQDASLVVVFKPQTTESEMRRIVRTSGVRIVDGPTVTDAYLVSASDATIALARLRAEPAVTLAEPLRAEERP
ncbi:hypothetical protein GCM10027321_07960 [Massilia terrae]